MAEQKKSGGTRKRSSTTAASSKSAGAAKKASSAPKTTAAKSTPSKSAAAKPAAPRRKKNGSGPGTGSNQEIRQRMIQEAAYYRALNRGFGGDAAMDDWLVAEREIDSMLGRLGG